MNANTVTEGHSSEKKRILVFFGSPHAHGTTAELLEAFLVPFREQENCKIKIIDAYQERIEPCSGCGYCKAVDGCKFPDFDRIDAGLREADLLVFASPVYNLGFPAPMKAILDRTQRYFEARFTRNERPPIPKHKSAALLLTMGADSLEGAEMIEKQLRMVFTVMNTTLESSVYWRDTDRQKHNPAALEQAKKAALAIHF